MFQSGMSERKDGTINISYSKVQIEKLKEMHPDLDLDPLQDMFMFEFPYILKLIEKRQPTITINFIDTDKN